MGMLLVVLEKLRRNKKNILTLFVATALLFGGAFYYRSEIASAVWYRFHIFPQMSLYLTNDAVLAVSAGNYYFNEFKDGTYDLDKAERYFKKALKLDPNVYIAWFQLARIDFLRGRLDSALLKINKQIALHGDELDKVYYIRGLIYGYRGYAGDSGKAEADFLKFLESNKRSWAAHNDLAWVYFKNGDFKQAEKWARKGIEAGNYNNPWLLTMRGVSFINLGRKAEARELLEKALEEADKLTEKDWELAYPGNDPLIAKQGLKEVKDTILFNLKLTVDN